MSFGHPNFGAMRSKAVKYQSTSTSIESGLLSQVLHTATANMLIYFRFVVDACSELNLRQANCLSSIFYLKFRFYTQ